MFACYVHTHPAPAILTNFLCKVFCLSPEEEYMQGGNSRRKKRKKKNSQVQRHYMIQM